VWVRVLRSHKEGREAKTTDHQLFADYHLPFDTFRGMLDWDVGPVEMLRAANQGRTRRIRDLLI